MTKYEATTQDNKCIFCEISAGNMQTAGLFWEDEEFMAWLAIDPNTKGFSCVIPKKHFGSDVLKMPDDVLQRYIIASKKVAAILENYFEDVGRVGLIMEGTGIDHAHIKLVPFHGTENLKKGIWKQVPSGKEFWFDKYEGWISSGSGPMADPEDLKKLASEIVRSQELRPQERVYEVVRQIPAGTVLTYGEVARRAGLSTPRVVGKYLHDNPDPTTIPCHRVVNSRGQVSANFAFGGAQAQIQLLQKEGVVIHNKRVIR